MSGKYHPLIEKLSSQLVATGPSKEIALGLTEKSAKWLQGELKILEARPLELKKAVDDLMLFAQFLDTQQQSPHAANAIRFIVSKLPDFRKKLAELETQRTGDHVEKVGPKFNHFLSGGNEPPPGTDIPKPTDPELAPLSARELLRMHIR